MQASIRHNHPLQRMFSGLVEDSFYTQLGLCDPGVVEYVVDLLVEFCHIDHVYPLRDSSGRRLEQVADMITQAATPPGTSDTEHRRFVHRHVGDYTLFWTGLYPESLGQMKRSHAADGLLDYPQTGKRSYAIASELSSDRTRPAAKVLRRLSEEFESCAYGLTLVRKGWEQKHPDAAAAWGLWV